MARYTGPKWRINRRENSTVLGTSENWKRHPTAPGQFPRPKKHPSEYANQFREKQRVKRMYGLQEKQFHNAYLLARKSRGNTGTRLLQLLELRLDNVVFKLGFARTRAEARQMVTHGHILLNGKKHNIPSTVLGGGDEVQIKEQKLNSEYQKATMAGTETQPVEKWMERFSTGGKVVSEPTREMIDPSIRENMIIELYSR